MVEKPMSDRYAVMGDPIGHSKSPLIHRLFAEQTHQAMEYEAILVPGESFVPALARFWLEGGRGCNCTVPLKERAFAHLMQSPHQLSARARHARAVNTLVLREDGSLMGDNTDGVGLIRDLQINHQVSLQGSRVLILGAGGAARGIVQPILESSPSAVVVANRTPERALELVADFESQGRLSAETFDRLGGPFDLILNATAASLTGEIPPLPNDLLAASAICYDLAYGSEPTPFVKWANHQGAAKSLDGLGMLVEQAAEAFWLWRGIRPDTRPVIDRLNRDRVSQ